MPKNKLEDAVFTAIMATVMVYGMIVYNVALNTGKVDGTTCGSARTDFYGSDRFYS